MLDGHAKAARTDHRDIDFRAAAASEKAADWAEAQFWLNLFGLIGIAGTLLLSYRQLRISGHTLAAEHRPWIAITAVSVGEVSDEWSHFHISVSNSGKTPARYLIEARLSGAADFGLSNRAQPPAKPSPSMRMIGPSQIEEHILWVEFEDKRVPPPKLLVSVCYFDPLSKVWRFSDCLYWIGSQRRGPRSVSSLAYENGKATGVAVPLEVFLT